MASTDSNTPTRESGEDLHRRETRRQIWLPFGAGLVLLFLIVAGLALQSQPIWRVRIEALASWTNTLLCLLPLVICAFPVYLLIIWGIYGMHRLHNATETPLRKVENLAGTTASRIESLSTFVNEKTIAISANLAPYMKAMRAFDQSAPAMDDDTQQQPKQQETSTDDDDSQSK